MRCRNDARLHQSRQIPRDQLQFHRQRHPLLPIIRSGMFDAGVALFRAATDFCSPALKLGKIASLKTPNLGRIIVTSEYIRMDSHARRRLLTRTLVVGVALAMVCVLWAGAGRLLRSEERRVGEERRCG